MEGSQIVQRGEREIVRISSELVKEITSGCGVSKLSMLYDSDDEVEVESKLDNEIEASLFLCLNCLSHHLEDVANDWIEHIACVKTRVESATNTLLIKTREMNRVRERYKRHNPRVVEEEVRERRASIQKAFEDEIDLVRCLSLPPKRDAAKMNETFDQIASLVSRNIRRGEDVEKLLLVVRSRVSRRTRDVVTRFVRDVSSALM